MAFRDDGSSIVSSGFLHGVAGVELLSDLGP